MFDRRDRGFSLVELMLVMGIIAILIGIAIPSLLGFRTRAMDTQTQSMLTAVARGQAGWAPENNGFTDDLALLESTFPEFEFGDAADSDIHVTLGDVVAGDSGQVLLYARSDSGTWLGIRYVASGVDVGRHTCSGAEADMTLVACSGTDSVITVVGGVLGLLIGSFLNVVAYRVPRGDSVIDPPSACPACGHPIRHRDNVPVVSWALLRGHCRDCGVAISARYAVVEASTAAIFVATALVVGSAWVLPAYWWFAAVCITLVLTDLDHQRIPNRILFPGIVVGAVLLTAGGLLDGDPTALLRAAGGGAAYFALLFGIAVAARGGFGFGDVKLAALLGMFLGYVSWGVLVVGVFAAFFVGGMVALFLMAARRAGRKDAIPFGPALVAGAFIAVAWGDAIAEWYIG